MRAACPIFWCFYGGGAISSWRLRFQVFTSANSSLGIEIDDVVVRGHWLLAQPNLLAKK